MTEEPLKERVSLALRDLLRATDGHYRPTKVMRVDDFDDTWLEAGVGEDQVLVFQIPDEVADDESTYTDVSSNPAYDLIVAKRYIPAVTSPLKPEWDNGDNMTRETIQNRLEADIKNQIRSDKTLGGLALHTTVPVTEKGADATWHPGWAVVFMRVEIQLDHEDEAA